MIRNDGTAAFWEAVLFIIADCGADIIVGYPTLKLGGIVEYIDANGEYGTNQPAPNGKQ